MRVIRDPAKVLDAAIRDLRSNGFSGEPHGAIPGKMSLSIPGRILRAGRAVIARSTDPVAAYDRIADDFLAATVHLPRASLSDGYGHLADSERTRDLVLGELAECRDKRLEKLK
jgi:hypothetical protein